MFKKILNILFNKNENNMEIIKTGHYQSISSVNSENKSFIRVIGEADTPGMWKLSDKKVYTNNLGEKYSDNILISEYELLNHYVYCPTSIHNEEPVNFNKNLLDGLDDSDDFEYYVDDIKYLEDYEETKSNEKNIVENIKENSTPILNEEEIFIKSLIHKIRTNNPSNLELKINIPIYYDLNKLSEFIKILNLDVDSVSKLLIKLFINNNDTYSLIENALKIQLINENEIKQNTENIISNENNDIIETERKNIVDIVDDKNSNIEELRINIMNKISKFYNDDSKN